MRLAVYGSMGVKSGETFGKVVNHVEINIAYCFHLGDFVDSDRLSTWG